MSIKYALLSIPAEKDLRGYELESSFDEKVREFWRLDPGASSKYHIHYASMARVLLLSDGFSALAGLYPVRRAARTNIVEALSYE